MNHLDVLEQYIADQQLNKMAAQFAKSGPDHVDRELDALLAELSSPPEENDYKVASSEAPTSSTATTILPKLEPTYSFPVGHNGLDGLVTDKQVDLLSAVVESWMKHNNYMRIRDEYCRLSISLNHSTLLAPAFRPFPTIPFLKKNQSESDKVLHRDRVVIDCHWLRCRNELVVPRDKEYGPLFDVSVPFSFNLAASFACENWSSKHRAEEALILTPWQQPQLLSMQDEAVRNRRKEAEEGIGRGVDRRQPKIVLVRKTIREWCRKDKRIIPHLKTYEDLWLARELLGDGASMNEIAKLGGMIAGVPPLSEKSIRDKLAFRGIHRGIIQGASGNYI